MCRKLLSSIQMVHVQETQVPVVGRGLLLRTVNHLVAVGKRIRQINAWRFTQPSTRYELLSLIPA